MNFYHTASGADPLRTEGILSLDDIRAKVGEANQKPARRDALSAFRVIAERGHIDLASVPASASGVRRLFDDIGPTDLGVSGRRYANIRSLIAGAVGQFGMRRRQLTKDAPIGTEWIALLDSVERASDRWALSRLARYGTAMQVDPEAVDAETLRGFVEAMDAEAMIKDPRRHLKHTIAIWNMCAKRIPDWPTVRLASFSQASSAAAAVPAPM